MNIVFILPHIKKSGGIRVMLSYAEKLTEFNNCVTVVVEAIPRIRFLRKFIKKKHVFLNKDTKVKIRYIKDLKSLDKNDIYIADSWEMADKLYNAKVEGKKFHTIQHDERLYHGDREKVSEVYARDLKKIVVSTWLQEMLEKDFGQKSELLLNTVDRNIFYLNKSDKSNDKINILILNHNYEWKGTQEGVEIVNELKKKYPNINLILFGTRQKECEYDCDEYYYDLPQEKLAWLYSKADIFLCPSWDEGFGLPSLEAMSCGCALITYDNGGSRDFALDERTAMVADRRDKQMLKEKLESLIKDKAKRENIAQAGLDFVSKMPTWEEQAGRVLEIINRN